MRIFEPTAPLMRKENSTPSQVGALLETMGQKIHLIAEAVAPLPERLSHVEERLEKVESRLTGVEDAVRVAIRVAIPSLAKRVERLETKVRI